MANEDEAWALVQDAILAFNAKVPDITAARGALTTVIRKGAWQEYQPPLGKRCRYTQFAQWVKASVPRGLGTTIENINKIAEGDVALTDALDDALGRKPRSDKITDSFNNIQDSGDLYAPEGTSRRAALRRLRKDRPDLHKRVTSGEVSANWAMVEAKFRPRTITVPITRPETVAKSLLKYMSADDIAKLIAVLLGQKPGD